MSRKQIRPQIQTTILVQSRRRCCICFGLNRDTRLKGGQIAHLDQNANNNTLENLAFLCFDHHDEFDSRTSQRKGFLIDEVKQYRDELIGSLDSTFSQSVHFGELQLPASDPYAGKYIIIDGSVDSAEIVLTPIPDTNEGDARYAVTGLALWGSQREYGPNLGIMDFVGIMDGGVLRWIRDCGNEPTVSILSFDRAGGLEVTEKNWVGAYGMNVTFQGTYRRA